MPPVSIFPTEPAAPSAPGLARPRRRSRFAVGWGRPLLAVGVLAVGALAVAWSAPGLQAHPESFRELVRAQSAKVVHIGVQGKAPEDRSPSAPFGAPEPGGGGTGSGFVLTADGYIVTNHHVVKDAGEIQVTLLDERHFPARVVGTDAQTDLALLKIEASGLPSVTFGDSALLEVGDWVVAIGNPLGLQHTVTAGIVSAKGRNIFEDANVAYGEFLQTDAAINPGSSGGPLFNMEGQVVGVNSAVSRHGQGIGFAVPSNLAAEIIARLRRDGYVRRGWLGVAIRDVNAEDMPELALPAGVRGIHVQDVAPDSPAAAGGVLADDVLTHIGAEPLRRVPQLQKLVALAGPGRRVSFRLLRRSASGQGGWSSLKLDLEIGESPRQVAAREPALLDRLGIRVDAASAQVPTETPGGAGSSGAGSSGAGSGATRSGVRVAEVDPGLPGAALGLEVGDAILEVQRAEVATPDELERALRDAKSERISLLVRRASALKYLVLSRAAMYPQ